MIAFAEVAVLIGVCLLICRELLLQKRNVRALAEPRYYLDLEDSARYARTLLRNGAASHALRELDAALKD